MVSASRRDSAGAAPSLSKSGAMLMDRKDAGSTLGGAVIGRAAQHGAQQRFLDAFQLRSLPGSEFLANGIPAGPCPSHPNEDSWTDPPFAPGVLLIGDAAGHNDPIIGQG